MYVLTKIGKPPKPEPKVPAAVRGRVPAAVRTQVPAFALVPIQPQLFPAAPPAAYYNPPVATLHLLGPYSAPVTTPAVVHLAMATGHPHSGRPPQVRRK